MEILAKQNLKTNLMRLAEVKSLCLPVFQQSAR
jgi:hypothetical protein